MKIDQLLQQTRLVKLCRTLLLSTVILGLLVKMITVYFGVDALWLGDETVNAYIATMAKSTEGTPISRLIINLILGPFELSDMNFT
ncbi:hypothetical protein C9I98_17855 [Photobacterium sanctipauli]|uniref:Uncharacterized protein n=1 Tax=Photobacterium sanctipauli TaxID=1342794 RepID=A0A2T3NPQ4_9GAMM|nr:hypothetical protein [Photobacterium sanctipauli]PSW18240.1 hypothetical protein C9I98_17855 [Photobacterium sanctipauli]